MIDRWLDLGGRPSARLHFDFAWTCASMFGECSDRPYLCSMPRVENESSFHQVYLAGPLQWLPRNLLCISAGEYLRGKRGDHLEFSLVFVDIVGIKIGLYVSALGTVGVVSLWLSRQHGGRKKLHAGCSTSWLEKREVGKPSIECIQKHSDHAVDWFLVSPGLTLRWSRSL